MDINALNPDTVTQFLEAHRDELVVDTNNVQEVMENLIARKQFEALDEIMQENKKAWTALNKIYTQSKKQHTEEQEEQQQEENQKKDWWKGVPVITKKTYQTVTKLPVSIKHKLFGTDDVPCENNIIFHFKYQDDNDAQKTHEFSRIKCGDVTNNYLQMIVNRKTKNVSVISPDASYYRALIDQRQTHGHGYSFLPVKITLTGVRTGHACQLAIDNASREVFYFDPNGKCEPENAFINKCLAQVFTKLDLGFIYVPIENWNVNCDESLQLPTEQREPFNTGDCVILSLLFAQLVDSSAEDEGVTAHAVNRMYGMTPKARKQVMNKLYQEVVKLMPKKGRSAATK